MRTTIGIDVEAPPELVYRLACDVSTWEHLLPHYARSRVVARHADGAVTCTFVARRPLVPLLGLGLPVAWRSRAWHEPATRRLHFEHVGGATRGMRVVWTIEALGGDLERTRVEISHDFRSPIPGFAAFVDRWLTRPIAGRTLRTFKVVAEAVRPVVAAASEASAATGRAR